MRNDHTYAVVVLAAGASRRMGRPKQGLMYHGEPLVKHAVSAALEVSDRVLVVTGANKEVTEEAIAGMMVTLVHNEDWETGMASSIFAGIEYLEAGEDYDAGVIITTCDQPMLTADHLQALINEMETTGAGIVASVYSQTMATPAIFDRKYFHELKGLKGDRGAKELFVQHASDTRGIAFPGGEIDMDTETDYETLLKMENDPGQA